MATKVLGKNVKRFRLEKRLSQDQLAELVGTKQPHISVIESGRAPEEETVERIAKALDRTVDEVDPHGERYDPSRDGMEPALPASAQQQEAVASMVKTDLRLASIVNLYIGMGEEQQKRLSRAASRIADNEDVAEGDVRARRRRLKR